MADFGFYRNLPFFIIANWPRLFETLLQSRGDDSYLKMCTKLSRIKLSIDDFLLTLPAD
jgi:hypothetical protein